MKTGGNFRDAWFLSLTFPHLILQLCFCTIISSPYNSFNGPSLKPLIHFTVRPSFRLSNAPFAFFFVGWKEGGVFVSVASHADVLRQATGQFLLFYNLSM